jgi:hypothetical protein
MILALIYWTITSSQRPKAINLERTNPFLVAKWWGTLWEKPRDYSAFGKKDARDGLLDTRPGPKARVGLFTASRDIEMLWNTKLDSAT